MLVERMARMLRRSLATGTAAAPGSTGRGAADPARAGSLGPGGAGPAAAGRAGSGASSTCSRRAPCRIDARSPARPRRCTASTGRGRWCSAWSRLVAGIGVTVALIASARDARAREPAAHRGQPPGPAPIEPTAAPPPPPSRSPRPAGRRRSRPKRRRRRGQGRGPKPVAAAKKPAPSPAKPGRQAAGRARGREDRRQARRADRGAEQGVRSVREPARM